MTTRYAVLDGWRAISICLVLTGHLLPLGPASWGLNGVFASSGMAIFFILSGFLITQQLSNNPSVLGFLVRRFVRILPLAWLAIALSLLWWGAEPRVWLSNLFFYANWPPMQIPPELSHFWSLCVEMQFYVLVALLVAVVGQNGLWLLPLLAFSVTGFKLHNDVGAAINTYYRIDEILAGCILALVYNHTPTLSNKLLAKVVPSTATTLSLTGLIFLSCHGALADFTRFFTGYIAMLAVGSTLYQKNYEHIVVKILGSRLLNYIAQISFALYVTHGIARHTWLGSGDTLEKYFKRPLLFVTVFLISHWSTFHYERYWVKLAKNYSPPTRVNPRQSLSKGS